MLNDLKNKISIHRYKVEEQMLNVNGTLFGGTAMGWMDKVGHQLSVELTHQTMYTLSADKIKFLKPVFLHEIADVRAEPIELGSFKLSILMTVIADPDGPNRREALRGIFTYVQLDKNHRPQRISYYTPNQGAIV